MFFPSRRAVQDMNRSVPVSCDHRQWLTSLIMSVISLAKLVSDVSDRAAYRLLDIPVFPLSLYLTWKQQQRGSVRPGHADDEVTAEPQEDEGSPG